ncbi:MAG: hypothetical protein NTU79_17360 [Planctomycetota bacterium]|nr:hypothetical protein [Planctomycetota bacterium]
MSIFIVVISSLSQYLTTPNIRSYHAAFFHGVAHRNGEWTPFETKGMDATMAVIPILRIWSNQYYVPHYCHPGSWPVVSENLRDQLSGVSSVKFLPVEEERTVNYPWRIGEPIEIEPGDMWRIQLLESLAAVEPTKLGTRYEMVSYRYKKIIGDYELKHTTTLTLDTPPSTETFEYSYCEAFLNDYPIHWVSGSMVFRKDYWSRVEPYIDKPFFTIREFELASD